MAIGLGLGVWTCFREDWGLDRRASTILPHLVGMDHLAPRAPDGRCGSAPGPRALPTPALSDQLSLMLLVPLGSALSVREVRMGGPSWHGQRV